MFLSAFSTAKILFSNINIITHLTGTQQSQKTNQTKQSKTVTMKGMITKRS